MMHRLIPASAIALLLLVTAGTAEPDKVTFPTGYKTNHVLYTTVDRPDNKTVRDIYASREAGKMAKAGQPLPSGAVITMEVYKAKVDDKGEPVKDANGRFTKDAMTGIFVMEKRTGWGAEYSDELRNGEWEYARFTVDGKPPEKAETTACFQCHKPMSGQDFVFTLPQLGAAP
jgi:Cytochrome P460